MSDIRNIPTLLLDGLPSLALYGVSFLYYGVYWRAFAWGTDSFSAFKRHTVLLKTLSVAVLAVVYLQAPLEPLSLAVIAAGIALNARAAAVLGVDRTYYGVEIAGLPPIRATAFPYSWLDHPMIVGNVMAYGGTLLNPTFREQWWPLATLHVVLNLGLLAMELAGSAHRPAVRAGGPVIFAAVALAAIALTLQRGA